MHENREISCTSWPSEQDRSAKAINRTADMNVPEKSDCAVVPVNQSNKGEHRAVAHATDTEREGHVPGTAWCAESSQRKEAGTVHRSAPPLDRRTAAREL